MIHVDAMPEPAMFDAKVRQKGLDFLRKKGIDLSLPLPPKTHIKPCWRSCLDDLYESYNGTCAYLCLFFERVTGGGSVDHFIAKSKRADLAYEWSNYRLACTAMNSRKCSFDDVLDPFEIEDGWFHMEFFIGQIYPNPELPQDQRHQVAATIKRLGLDDDENRKMRLRHFRYYYEDHWDEIYLKKASPFVWYEAWRQGLL